MKKLDLKASSMSNDAVKYFLGRLAAGVSGFLFIPILTRAIGLDEYGRYGMMMAMVGLVSQSLGAWLQQGILRYHYSLKDSSSYWYSIKIGLYLQCTLVLACAAMIVHSDSVSENLLVVIITLLSTVYIVGSALQQASLNPSRIMYADIMRGGVPVLLLLPFLFINDVIPLYFGLVVVALGYLGGAWLLLRQSLTLLMNASPQDWRPKLTMILKYGFPIGLWFAFFLGQILFGRWVLQYYGNLEQAGIFAAVQEFFTKALSVLLMPVVYAVHGWVMAKSGEGSVGNQRELLHRAYTIISVISLIFIILVWAGYPLIIGILGLPENHVSIEFILEMAIAGILGVVILVGHKGLELANRTSSMAIFMGLSLLVNVSLAVNLAKVMGKEGVALAMIASLLFYWFMSHIGSTRALSSLVPASGTISGEVQR